MAGKRANGEGSISYDKRRKRYRAKITIGWEINNETGRVKQIVKTLGSNYKTKGEASAALAEYLQNPFDLSNKDITFSQLYEKWFKECIEDKKSSMAYRVKAAYKYCSEIYDKRIIDITILDMKKCINNGTVIPTRGKYKNRERTASPQTKESIKYIFNHVMAYATEARLIRYNIAKEFALDKSIEKQKKEEHKEKVPFRKEQLEQMWNGKDFIPFCDMLLYNCYSGWRPSELIEIRVENVHLDENYIVGGKKTDAGKERIVPIHQDIKPIVEKYYKEAISVKSEYLFNDLNTRCGIGLSYDQWCKRFNAIMKILKYDDIYTPHCCRHTFTTLAKSKDVQMNEYALKIIIGHRIKDITEEIYNHWQLPDLIEEMNKIKVLSKS